MRHRGKMNKRTNKENREGTGDTPEEAIEGRAGARVQVPHYVAFKVDQVTSLICVTRNRFEQFTNWAIMPQ